MALVSLLEAQRLTGVSRATLYRRIHSGDLSASKNPSGATLVDTSELQRVFVNLSLESHETPQNENLATARDAEILQQRVELLEQQIKLLGQQLEKSEQRELELLELLKVRLLTSPKGEKRKKRGKKSK